MESAILWIFDGTASSDFADFAHIVNFKSFEFNEDVGEEEAEAGEEAEGVEAVVDFFGEAEGVEAVVDFFGEEEGEVEEEEDVEVGGEDGLEEEEEVEEGGVDPISSSSNPASGLGIVYGFLETYMS